MIKSFNKTKSGYNNDIIIYTYKKIEFNIIKYDNGYYYGEILNGKKHGKGIMKYNNGCTIYGIFTNDEIGPNN